MSEKEKEKIKKFEVGYCLFNVGCSYTMVVYSSAQKFER
jgi:hypothetical protein